MTGPTSPDNELTEAQRLLAVRLIARRVKSWEEAEDVVQEAMLKLFERPSAAAVANPAALLIKVSLNIAIDRFRSASARVDREHQWAEFKHPPTSSTQDPEQAVLARADLRASVEALESLGPSVRKAFVLHRLQGYSLAEVAERTGLSQSTVEKHVMKARKVLLRRRRQFEVEEKAARVRPHQESE